LPGALFPDGSYFRPLVVGGRQVGADGLFDPVKAEFGNSQQNHQQAANDGLKSKQAFKPLADGMGSGPVLHALKLHLNFGLLQ